MFFKSWLYFTKVLLFLVAFPVCWLIIYKSALDKICLIHGIKE